MSKRKLPLQPVARCPVAGTETTAAFESFGLGRVEPVDYEHLDKYPLKAAISRVPAFKIEKLLPLPVWHQKHDQGREGACVGFGTTMMLAILNLHQVAMQGAIGSYIRYNPWWLWDRAKEIDSFPHSNPGDQEGTTVRAACETLRSKGIVTWPNEGDPKSIGPVNPYAGIATYRWALDVDEVRYALYNNLPVTLGVNWYQDFYKPVNHNAEWWIGRTPTKLGKVMGGHCVCAYGASDARQAIRIKNSWGASYPEVWMPYKALERLLKENGEAALITDR
jgi:hypothetical protein